MVIEVNPPPQIPIPRKILDDEELRDFFIYQQEYLFKLWLRTGGGNDSISALENGELYEPGIQTSDTDELETELEPIDKIETTEDREEIKTAVSFTTTGSQDINCTNASSVSIVITLNSTPADQEDTHISRRDGPVRVSGAINGGTFIDFLSKFDTADLIYHDSLSEWVIS